MGLFACASVAPTPTARERFQNVPLDGAQLTTGYEIVSLGHRVTPWLGLGVAGGVSIPVRGPARQATVPATCSSLAPRIRWPRAVPGGPDRVAAGRARD
jgi:hypothetical protein